MLEMPMSYSPLVHTSDRYIRAYITSQLTGVVRAHLLLSEVGVPLMSSANR